MSWGNQKTVKKGTIGEAIVTNYLVQLGYIPYSPDIKGAHPFDRLCASKDKKKVFIADSKAKPARTYYPDTGIDIKHYQDYKYIQDKYNIDVFLFFVDEDAEEVYGNWLRVLDKPRTIIHNALYELDYPLEQKGIRYFPLEAMIKIGDIPKEDLEQLRKYSTRNNAYVI